MRFGQWCPKRRKTFIFGCSLGFLLILLAEFWLVKMSLLSLAFFLNGLLCSPPMLIAMSAACPADAANNGASLDQQMPGLTSKCSAKTCSQQMKVPEFLLIPAELSSSGEYWPLVLAAKYMLKSLGNLVVSCDGGFWEKGGQLDEGSWKKLKSLKLLSSQLSVPGGSQDLCLMVRFLSGPAGD